MALNIVDVVALNTILVLRLSKTGWTVGRTLDWTDGRRTDDFIGLIASGRGLTLFDLI